MPTNSTMPIQGLSKRTESTKINGIMINGQKITSPAAAEQELLNPTVVSFFMMLRMR